jgi:hypothetical protein
LGLLGRRFGLASRLLRLAAHDLLDAYRKRAPRLDTYERQREKGPPWHRLAVQAREETIQAMRGLASFGDHDFVTSEQVDIICPVSMLTKKCPKQHRPRERRREKALDGTVTAALARPAGDAAHRDPSRHDQHGQRNPTALAVGRRRHVGLQALEKC